MRVTPDAVGLAVKRDAILGDKPLDDGYPRISMISADVPLTASKALFTSAVASLVRSKYP
jgi:hypothetical protein